MAGLSKSRLMAFRQCPKRLWLERHRPELAIINAEQQAAFDTGHAVGELARALYDGAGTGRLISGAGGMAAALRETRAALGQDAADPLFEATFEREGLLVRADVLERRSARLVEVKSSTSVKDEHLADCAIQTWVLEASPVPPQAVVVAHVDSRFTYDGSGCYAGLLRERDVTAQARTLAREVPDWLDAARRVVSLGEPEVAIGTRCLRPYACPFMGHCWPRTDYPLTGLPGAGRRLDDLLARGYRDVRDLPRHLVPAGDGLRAWRAARSGRPEDSGSARAELAQLAYPRHFLDFETIAPAVPLWAGTRPYQAIPFQWSLHTEDGPGRLRHAECLDLSGDLPARAVAAALLAALDDAGPILTYTNYEAMCLRTLAAFCPDLAQGLESVIARLVDLHPIARRAYYHPAMQGSWSIKALLPAIAPDLDYARLEGVRDGGGAQQAYAEAIAPGTSAARRAELQEQLLRYCAHDTLAMVRIAQFLGSA